MWNKLDDVERAQPDEQRGQTKLARNPAQVDDETLVDTWVQMMVTTLAQPTPK